MRVAPKLCSRADSIKIKRWILVQDYETIGVHVRIEVVVVVIMRRHASRLQHSLLRGVSFVTSPSQLQAAPNVCYKVRALQV
jgi:hypothetical protein